MRVDAQLPLDVIHRGENVRTYLADMVVEGELVVKLKCAERLGADHTAQYLNYLRASGRDVCLLVNFQSPRVEWKRILRPGGGRVNSAAERAIPARAERDHFDPLFHQFHKLAVSVHNIVPDLIRSDPAEELPGAVDFALFNFA